MSLFISIFYAPAVFFALRNLEIKSVAVYLMMFSFLWFLFEYKGGVKSYIFSLFYLIVGVGAFVLEDELVLRLLPSLISATITLYMCYSYMTKNSFIFYFLKRFKVEIKEKERAYIHSSTPFWIGLSLINLCVLSYLGFENSPFWVYYASFGWILLFGFGGVLQFVHKKFIR